MRTVTDRVRNQKLDVLSASRAEKSWGRSASPDRAPVLPGGRTSPSGRWPYGSGRCLITAAMGSPIATIPSPMRTAVSRHPKLWIIHPTSGTKQGSESDARPGDSKGHASPAPEPVRHGRDHRSPQSQAAAGRDHQQVHGIEREQGVYAAHRHEAEPQQGNADEHHAPGAVPVYGPTLQRAEQARLKPADRDHGGDGRTVPAELVGEGYYEVAEAVEDDARRHRHAERAGDDDPPAVEQPPASAGTFLAGLSHPIGQVACQTPGFRTRTMGESARSARRLPADRSAVAARVRAALVHAGFPA